MRFGALRRTWAPLCPDARVHVGDVQPTLEREMESWSWSWSLGLQLDLSECCKVLKRFADVIGRSVLDVHKLPLETLTLTQRPIFRIQSSLLLAFGFTLPKCPISIRMLYSGALSSHLSVVRLSSPHLQLLHPY